MNSPTVEDALDLVDVLLKEEAREAAAWSSGLRTMDVVALEALVSRRQQRQPRLVGALALLKAAPQLTPPQQHRLAALKRLATSISNADAVRRAITLQAIKTVQGYLGVLAPRPLAYARNGQTLAAHHPPALSQRG